jgi:hypothetical protein
MRFWRSLERRAKKWNPVFRETGATTIESTASGDRDRPKVTAIVATYNRPSSLLLALESVRRQTYCNWRTLVIGDACGPETEEAIAKLNDPRISYVNLSCRVGEQSGPNSVGMALSETPYTAFLNHDDLWLPDHLECAVAALESSDSDFFTGQAAFARKVPQYPDQPLFVEISPTNRRLADAFASAFFLFEPCSAWVFRTEAARRVGPWGHSSALMRTPLQDWILRAWRAGVKHCNGKTVTVLKNNVSFGPAGSPRKYEHPEAVLGVWLEEIETAGLDAMRARIAIEIEKSKREGLGRDFEKAGGPKRFQEIAMPLSTSQAQDEFFRTGRDIFNEASVAAGLEPGWLTRNTLKGRTGESGYPAPDLNALIDKARMRLRSEAAHV